MGVLTASLPAILILTSYSGHKRSQTKTSTLWPKNIGNKMFKREINKKDVRSEGAPQEKDSVLTSPLNLLILLRLRRLGARS